MKTSASISAWLSSLTATTATTVRLHTQRSKRVDKLVEAWSLADATVDNIQDSASDYLNEANFLKKEMFVLAFEEKEGAEPKEVGREKVTFERIGEVTDDDGAPKLDRIFAAAVDQSKHCLDAVMKTNAVLRETIEAQGANQQAVYSSFATLMSEVHDIASLRRESDDAAAKERLQREAVHELGGSLANIVQAGIAKVMGATAGAKPLLQFFKSLREDQLAAIQQTLTGDQGILLASLVAEAQKAIESEQKKEG